MKVHGLFDLVKKFEFFCEKMGLIYSPVNFCRFLENLKLHVVEFPKIGEDINDNDDIHDDWRFHELFQEFLTNFDIE